MEQTDSGEPLTCLYSKSKFYSSNKISKTTRWMSPRLVSRLVMFGHYTHLLLLQTTRCTDRDKHSKYRYSHYLLILITGFPEVATCNGSLIEMSVKWCKWYSGCFTVCCWHDCSSKLRCSANHYSYCLSLSLVFLLLLFFYIIYNSRVASFFLSNLSCRSTAGVCICLASVF